MAATWRASSGKIQVLLENLRRSREVIQSRATIVQIQDIREIRIKGQETLDRQTKQADEDRLTFLKGWLLSSNVTEQHESLQKQREDVPGSGHWLLRRKEYEEWASETGGDKPFLWLTGIPGAGEYHHLI